MYQVRIYACVNFYSVGAQIQAHVKQLLHKLSLELGIHFVQASIYLLYYQQN